MSKIDELLKSLHKENNSFINAEYSVILIKEKRNRRYYAKCKR